MRVLLLNQYFWPDLSAAAQMMTDLAEDLARAGAEVTVLTGRHAYTGEASFPASETWRGVRIERVAATHFGRGHLAGRAADHASFLASAAGRLVLRRGADVVLTACTPPFLPALGLLHRRMSRSRFLCWVHDLFPDAAVELGVLPRGGPATGALERLTRASLEGADAIVAIGDCMAERIAAKGIARERIQVIHNWADGEAIRPVPHEDNWFRARHGLEGRFVVLYSGNMGRGHDFTGLVGAARLLAHRPDIVFLFIGGGPRRGEVERASRGLPSVRFLPYQPREHLAYSLGAADLGVVTLRDEALGTMVPSKLYGHMASARPVLYLGPAASTTARTITEARCGATLPATDATAAAAFIEHLAADPARASVLGEAGRQTFDAHFDRRCAAARLVAACMSLGAPTSGHRRVRRNRHEP